MNVSIAILSGKWKADVVGKVVWCTTLIPEFWFPKFTHKLDTVLQTSKMGIVRMKQENLLKLMDQLCLQRKKNTFSNKEKRWELTPEVCSLTCPLQLWHTGTYSYWHRNIKSKHDLLQYPELNNIHNISMWYYIKRTVIDLAFSIQRVMCIGLCLISSCIRPMSRSFHYGCW